MTLHLLRLDPDAGLCARWFAAERLAPHEAGDEGYAWHALLCAAFGKDLAPRPFRAMARRGRPIQVLAYTQQEPATLKQWARDFADPLALDALGLTGGVALAAKRVPAFGGGRRLGFSLRVRPTVRTDRQMRRDKTAEVDAFVAALRAEPPARPDRKAVYADWTRGRLYAGGAMVLDMRFDGLDQIPIWRRDAGRALKPIQGHSASLAGVLEVMDADAFAACLARGVGRHRAFGYGMLLLSPP